MTLTTAQINTLQTFISSNNIAGFYSQLQSYGDSYGRLGLAVTLNNTWQGQMANGFAKSGAAANLLDLSYGSELWGTVNHELATAYLTLYQNNGGNTPTWSDVKNIHNTIYSSHNIPIDAWLPNKLLAESSDPSGLWSDYLVNTGAADLYQDAWGVTTNFLHLTYNPITGMTPNIGYAEKEYARNFIVAFAEMSPAYRSQMGSDFSLIGLVGQEVNDLVTCHPNLLQT